MAKQKRELLKALYKRSKSWAAKVDSMPDSQVIAVYLRLHREGKI